MFCKYMRGTTIATHVSSAAYEGETEPKWLAAAKDTPWLDVSAAVGDDGVVSMVVVNVHQTESQKVEVTGTKPSSGSVQVYSIAGDSWDVTNMAGTENVGIKESVWNGDGVFEFPSFSVTMLRWKP